MNIFRRLITIIRRWFKPNMYKRVEIHFTSPICQCEKQDLIWGLPCDNGTKHSLFVQCKTCKVMLNIPHEKFAAKFVFDEPYPANKKEEQYEHTTYRNILPIKKPTKPNKKDIT